VLFQSAAQVIGSRTLGFLMTGMGRDGADGLLQIKNAGGRCLSQDEESSVVFGMPKEGWENGAAERLVSLDRAADLILEMLAEGVGEGQWRR
jgi:two-component system chemotaxis response regulator CheB